MILQIHPENPNPREIKQVIECLKDGGVIVYPSATVYGIGCDIFNKKAVERVAKISGIHDFIVSLPEGYETKLGTTAISKLSVGQKQRIAIARGLLRDSKILILDEPTSALDPETEQYLVNALQEAAKDRLVIIIAHRLSTIAKADNIIFLEDGSILEQGPPEELMEIEGGHYRNYVRLQTNFPQEE